MNHRFPKDVLRCAIALLASALLVACQSDEEKLTEFYEQGQEYDEQEMYQEAVIEYKNVLKIDPNHADAHYQLAKAYLKLNRVRDAFWEMSETARLDPANTEAVLGFGALSLVADDGEQALAMGQMAVEAEPDNHQGYILKGKALEKLQRATESEELYLKAVELDTENYSTMFTLATYYASQPNGREKAEPWFWKSIEVFPTFQARTELAKFLIQDPERHDEAGAVFKEALERDAEPEDLEVAYTNLAKFYFATDRAAEGVATLEQGIEAVADSTPLLFMLATYYRSSGDVERAESLLRQAAEVDPSDPRAYLVLSAYLGGRGDLEGALEAAEQAIEADPSSMDAKLRRAELLVDLGYREARAELAQNPDRDLEQVAGANSKIRDGLQVSEDILAETAFQPQAEFVRGKAYLAMGNTDGGIEAFRAASEGRPDWAQAHFALGSALTSNGEPSVARVEVARALELDPSMHEARRVLATIHQALSEHEYAIEQGRRYLEVRPDSNETRVLVAQSLIRLGKREAALEELETVPAGDRDAAVLFALGRVHANLGHVAEGRGYLLKVLELSPGNQKALRSLFKIDEGDATNLAETKQLIVEAAEAHPEDSDLAQLHGMVLFTSQDLEGAEAEFIRATKLSRDDVLAHQQLARFYMLTGRTDETIATYKKALQVQPNSSRLHHFLALLYEGQGELELAQKSYEKAIEHDSEHASAKNNLAYLLADSGQDLDRALALAQEAKALLPNNANAADTLGWVLFKRGVSGAAVGYLKEAVENTEADDPTLGIVRHHLAQAYEADGNKSRAVEVLKTVVSDLERNRRAATAQGRAPQTPPWEADVRQMLDRLTANS